MAAGDTLTHKTDVDLARGTVEAEPRLRLNRTNPMTLTTTFQPIMLNGTSPYNTNSFGTELGQPDKMVTYDPATGLFRFNSVNEHSYVMQVSTSITANSLFSSLNLSTATLRLQCLIPRPAGQGGQITFPLPDFGGYVDVCQVNMTGQRNDTQPIVVFSNELIRTYGFILQACLSNTVLGTVMLNGCDVNLLSR